MPKLALTHLALHVRDLPANVAFYERWCGMRCIHRRGGELSGATRSPEVAWLAEPGREREFILVFISGGPSRQATEKDFTHLGFALDSREAVDAIAARAAAEGCLVWPPRQDPYPTGYYCGLQDPDGRYAEFSYGQPLGPGAEALDAERIGR
jgi:catechol 2,3-dioxygenase-like lactoylglutathione lyase family enzyme